MPIKPMSPEGCEKHPIEVINYILDYEGEGPYRKEFWTCPKCGVRKHWYEFRNPSAALLKAAEEIGGI